MGNVEVSRPDQLRKALDSALRLGLGYVPRSRRAAALLEETYREREEELKKEIAVRGRGQRQAERALADLVEERQAWSRIRGMEAKKDASWRRIEERVEGIGHSLKAERARQGLEKPVGQQSIAELQEALGELIYLQNRMAELQRQAENSFLTSAARLEAEREMIALAKRMDALHSCKRRREEGQERQLQRELAARKGVAAVAIQKAVRARLLGRRESHHRCPPALEDANHSDKPPTSPSFSSSSACAFCGTEESPMVCPCGLVRFCDPPMRDRLYLQSLFYQTRVKVQCSIIQSLCPWTCGLGKQVGGLLWRLGTGDDSGSDRDGVAERRAV